MVSGFRREYLKTRLGLRNSLRKVKQYSVIIACAAGISYAAYSCASESPLEREVISYDHRDRD